MKPLDMFDPGRTFPAAGLTRALGWFSIGLGIAELLVPRTVARSAGVEGRPALVRGAGMREIVTGIGVLTAPRPAPWLWGRVVGDALDLLAVGAGGSGRPRSARFGLALGTIAAIAALDVACARAQSGAAPRGQLPRDYAGRSGFPQSPSAMRGAARGGFGAPQAAGEPAGAGPAAGTPPGALP